ncbi:MAG: S1C family serine protease [Micromonosporaceae bacterium]
MPTQAGSHGGGFVPGQPAPGSGYQGWGSSQQAYTGSHPQMQQVGPYGQPQAAPQNGNRIGKALLMGLLALLIAVGGGVVGGLVSQGGQSGTPGTDAGDGVSRTGGDLALAEMAAKVQPSVVSITARAGNEQRAGSGVVISRDGLVLTNNHVAGEADEIEVIFDDEKSETAELVEADPNLDLAVLRIEGAKDLPAAPIGNSAKLRVGETVIAIGSPLGLKGSVTAGIVSGLNRTIPAREGGAAGGDIQGVIQTDAAINPGNSGGPLLNSAGEVVGINTAIATTSEQGGNIGLGFAVPVNAAKELLDKAGK